MATELDRAVRAVVVDCLGVARGEEVAVICNPVTEQLAARMRVEAQVAGADAVLIVMTERRTHAAEPPSAVAAAMVAADVVLAPTAQSLSHTTARRIASENDVRIATLPGVTEEMLARVMSADMAELRRRSAAAAAALSNGSEARISCAQGSDLRLGLGHRQAIADGGELSSSGAFGNLPCGEGFIAPLEGTGQGTLIVDGSIAGVGMLKSAVTLTVCDGHLTDASGKAGADLLQLLTVHGTDGTNVAELGIGTNEKAELTGNILEDEKILGSAHIAFGASAAIGGTVQVPVHLDCVVLKPKVEIDGEVLIDHGKLLV